MLLNILSTPFFHLAATKEIPEDQECHHCGAVLHQRMAGAHLALYSYCFEITCFKRLCINHDRNILKCLLACYYFLQARKLLRELKYQKRCEEAATTIAAYWHGTQVLMHYSIGYHRVRSLPRQSFSPALIHRLFIHVAKKKKRAPLKA